ncbi:YebC/PmpR family DNA-binding transcriptional regulator [Rhodocaloribacter sp.]
MAGHNKWSKIKRQKAATDAKRSKAWARITRDIMVAAREGGGDPGMNPRLALAIEKAKSENMPKDNIERAIKRGTGEIEGADYEEITYEGYAPHGVAVFVEALTDNTNRTVADLRALFSKAGGSLGQSGSVAFLFDRKSVFVIPAEGLDEMELFELVVEAGAEDLTEEDGTFIVTAPVEQFGAVQAALEAAGIEPEEASLQRIPTTTVTLDPEAARKVAALIEKIEEHPDVQAVYTTLNLDEATIEALS